MKKRKTAIILVIVLTMCLLAGCGDADKKDSDDPKPTATHAITPTPTPVPTKEPTPTESPVPELSPTEEPTPEPTEEPTPEPTEEPTPEPTPTVTQIPEISPTEEPTPTIDPNVTPELSVTPDPFVTPEASVTPDPFVTPEASVTPDPFVTPEASVTPDPFVTPEASVTPDPFVTPEASVTPDPNVSPEPTVEPTAEPTAEPTPTIDPNLTPTPIVGDSYKLNGLVYMIHVSAVYREPSEESMKMDDLQIGEFVAIVTDDSVFHSDEWYMVQYRNGQFGYVPKIDTTDNIPTRCIELGSKALEANDWVSLSEVIRDNYWNLHTDRENTSLTDRKIPESEIGAYKGQFVFSDGRTDRLAQQICYEAIATTKLYIALRDSEQNLVACGYDAEGDLVYLQEFIFNDESVTPYDSCRTATTADGVRVKEYEFVQQGYDRVLIFGAENIPETVLVYRYSDDITYALPGSRMDMFYDDDGYLETTVLTISGDTTHKYNTFYEYDVNGYLVRLLEVTQLMSNGEWTLRYGIERVFAGE